MTVSTNAAESISIEVSPDLLEAVLALGPYEESAEALSARVREKLSAKGIQALDEEALAHAVRQATGEHAVPVRMVVARGTPPVKPVDGRIEWTSGFFDPLAVDEGTEITHYERAQRLRMQRMVKGGQVVCRIVFPTEGTPGRDVYGKPIEVRQPKIATLAAGEGISVGDGGQTFTATVEGELRLAGDRLSIVQIMEVSGNVDFETGNIDFPGTVMIHGDVLDNFVVHSKGSIQVDGSVGAAEIVAKGSLDIRGGVKGRGRSLTKSDGNLTAKFLDYTFGKVEGDLLAENGIYLSSLRVKGRVEIRGGGIRGGKLYALGGIEVSTVGSSARTATLITTSPSVFLEQYWEKAGKALAQIEAKIAGLAGRVAEVMKRRNEGQRIAPQALEKAVLNARQVKELQADAQKLLDLRKQFEAEILSREPAEILVREMLHAGTQVALKTGVVVFTDDLTGPVTVRIREAAGAVSVSAPGKDFELRPRDEDAPADAAEDGDFGD